MNDSKIINFINTNSFKLVHRSASTDSDLYKATLRLGYSVVELICFTSALRTGIKDSDNLSYITTSIKESFQNYITYIFPKTEVYLHTAFGNGVTESEKNSKGVIVSLFEYYVGLLAEKNLLSTIYCFVDSIEGIELPPPKAPKTILQEHYQKYIHRLPKYITEQEPDSPGNAPIYHSILKFSDKLTFEAYGESKTKAESNVATKVCKYLDILPSKQYLKYKQAINKLTNLLQPCIPSNYCNTALNDFFHFSKKSNTIQTFIPSRFKGLLKNSTHPIVSNRNLATYGSSVIFFLSSATFLELTKSKVPINKDISPSFSSQHLLDFFNSGIILKNELPFKDHADYTTDSYYSDCIQALFGAMFILIITSVKLNKYQDILNYSDATKWVFNKFRSILTSDADINSSFVINRRLNKKGFSFKLERDKTYKLAISHIRTGGSFDIKTNKEINSRKEAMQYLTSVCLLALDRLEGKYFELPKTETAREIQMKLISFILRSSSKDASTLSRNNHNYTTLPSYTHEFKHIRTEDLIQQWYSKENIEIESLYLLHEIHNRLKLINRSVTISDYFSYFGIYPENKIEINTSQDTKRPKEANSHSDLNTALKPEDISDSHDLKNILQNYDTTPFEELMQIWENREYSFKFREEAAFVLSKIRYENGIDLKRKNYDAFLNSELVTALDLPHFREDTNTTPSSSSNPNLSRDSDNFVANKKSNTKIEDYILNKSDERKTKLGKLTIRVGQTEFRNNLLNLWGKCAISGCTTNKVLDAAHISPYRGEKDNNLRNGILLRTDIHRLFDSFLISINPDSLEVSVSQQVTDPTYTKLNGIKIEDKIQLSRESLEAHWLYFLSLNEFDR